MAPAALSGTPGRRPHLRFSSGAAASCVVHLGACHGHIPACEASIRLTGEKWPARSGCRRRGRAAGRPRPANDCHWRQPPDVRPIYPVDGGGDLFSWPAACQRQPQDCRTMRRLHSRTVRVMGERNLTGQRRNQLRTTIEILQTAIVSSNEYGMQRYIG